MKKKLTTILWLGFSLLWMAGESQGQTLNTTVSGLVTNQAGRPLPNKLVALEYYTYLPSLQFIHLSEDTVKTDSNGVYSHSATFTGHGDVYCRLVTLDSSLWAGTIPGVLFAADSVNMSGSLNQNNLTATINITTRFTGLNFEGQIPYNSINPPFFLRLYRYDSLGNIPVLMRQYFPSSVSQLQPLYYLGGFFDLPPGTYTISAFKPGVSVPNEFVLGGGRALNTAQWITIDTNNYINRFNLIPQNDTTATLVIGEIRGVTAADTAVVQVFAVGDTLNALYSMRFANLSLTGQFFANHAFDLPGNTPYLFRAQLTPGSANAANFVTTWSGNVRHAAQAIPLNTTAGGLDIHHIDLISALPGNGWLAGNVNGYPTGSTSADTLDVIVLEVTSTGMQPVDTLMLSDTLLRAGGYYAFRIPTQRDYTLLAVMRGPQANAFLPTYHQSTSVWSQATVINFNSNFQLADITLLPAPGTPLQGPGGINGQVGNGGLRVSNAISGVLVVLMNQNNEALLFTRTNAQGQFQFADLPFGTYKLRVEYPGLNSAVIQVALNAGNPVAGGNNFTLTPGGVTTSVAAEQAPGSWRVYPNPASRHVKLVTTQANDALVEVRLYDVQGRLVMHMQPSEQSNQYELDLQQLPQGLYRVSLQTNGGFQHISIVKNP